MKEEERQRAIRVKLARMDPFAQRGGGAVLPTGFAALDAALAVGGLPRGRIVEIFGPSSSGKTTLALQIVANLQKLGSSAAWIDAEHGFDAASTAALGVSLERMPVAQPESAEQALEIARQLAASGAIDLIVVDSAAALVPRLELETGVGQSGPGLQSRVLAQGLRKLGTAAGKSGACVLFLNQTRTKMETDGGMAEISAGGPPLKLFASVRIGLEPAPRGRVRLRVLKNKAAAAFVAGELRRELGVGFAKSP